MKRLAFPSMILAGLIVGCEPSYRGRQSASTYFSPDHETMTEVLAQRDPDGQLLFAITWTARNDGGFTRSLSHKGRLTHINGHPVHPRYDRRAVYALQPAGTIQQISLTDKQITDLFREMETDDFHTSHNDLWQAAVAPHLHRVEADNGS